MVQPLVHVERVLDFPVSIVWDALVDADLVGGWLAEADVDPRIGGRFDLRWVPEQGVDDLFGEIVDLDDGETLRVESAELGLITFTLGQVEGGSRGASTLLGITVAADLTASAISDLVATLETSLDQLTELLFGHPVDWSNWIYDWHGVWKQNRPRSVRRVT
jgi:uncharacterized protein YndB with AHSA1/START domain